MSGIEIVGLLLGAFPLLVSAMEYYEESKKVSSTWWRVKRAHKRDVGKIKDCQLKFRLNLKELLLPLEFDGVVNKGEYERLLADPGGQGWKEDHVEDALRERLSDCYERYMEVLSDILEVTARLSKECRVDDAKFQIGLKAKNERIPSATYNQQTQAILVLRANAAFEAKRIKYAFTGAKREDLLDQIDSYNDRLQDILAQNDRISTLDHGRGSHAIRRPNAKHLSFWSHAASIFRLLDKVWTCQCRSQVGLWLQHRSFHEVLLKMHLKLCSGQQFVQWRLTDTPPTIQLDHATRTVPSTRSASQASSVVKHNCSTTVAATRSGSGSKLTLTAKSTSTLNILSTSPMAQPDATSLENDGLCRTCSTARDPSKIPDTYLGRLSDGDNEYAIYQMVHSVPSTAATTLADLLYPRSTLRLTRVQRYGIALILASSHLQLHSTPWLKQHWTCDDVCFPTSSDGSAVTLYSEPYILANLSSAANGSSRTMKDRSFSTLAIILLELCFGSRLEDHRLWSNPVYATMKADPMIRQAIANEWLDEVQGEAGEEYATAVTWILRQAPAIVRDNSWRADFAENVVQPLQRHYEFLDPKK